MRVKLKYALPTVQMALVFVLLKMSDDWMMNAMRHGADMPGPGPSSSLLLSINLPLALVGAFFFHSVPPFWDRIAYAIVVGLFWYWVALNIRSWKTAKALVMFRCKPLRATTDLVLIGIGLLVAMLVWSESHFFVAIFADGIRNPSATLASSYTTSLWLWSVPTVGIYVAWIPVLIFFLGRDFIHCLLHKNPDS